MAIFSNQQKKYARLRVRRISLVLLYALVVLVYATTEIFPELIGYTNFPCTLRLIVFLSLAPFLFSLQVIRNILFIMMTKFSQSMMIYGRIIHEDDSSSGAERRKSKCQQLLWLGHAVLFCFQQVLHTDRLPPSDNPHEHLRILHTLKYMMHNRSIFLLFAVFNLPFVVVNVGVALGLYYSAGDPGCRRDMLITGICVAEFVLFYLHGYLYSNQGPTSCGSFWHAV